jgi:hypothetical protein
MPEPTVLVEKVLGRRLLETVVLMPVLMLLVLALVPLMGSALLMPDSVEVWLAVGVSDGAP